MASINSKKLLPSSNSTKEKNYLVPVENIIPGDTDKLKTSNDSQRKRKKTVLSEVLKVKRTVIKVEKLINNNKKLTEKDQKRKQKLLERDRFRKREQRLESKDSKQKSMGITPGLPKTGFLDSIKRFLFFTLLGAAFTKFGKHLSKISEFLNKLGPAFEFLESFTGNLLNGLIDFIDFGYSAYDTVQQFVKDVGGEDAEKKFNEFSKQFNTFANLAIIAGMASMSSGNNSNRDKFGSRQKRPKRVMRRYAQRYGAKSATRKFGKKAVQSLGGRFSKTVGRRIFARVPIIGGLLDFAFSLAMGEPVGRAAAKAVGATLGSALGSFIPIPFAGTILGGVLGDIVGGALYDTFTGTRGIEVKQGGGRVTRDGKVVGRRIRRGIKKEKFKLKLIEPNIQTTPGKDVGGEKSIQKLFPKNKDGISSFDALNKISGIFKDMPLVGSLMTSVVNVILGQKPISNLFDTIVLNFGRLFDLNAKSILSTPNIMQLKNKFDSKMTNAFNAILSQLFLGKKVILENGEGDKNGDPGSTDPGFTDPGFTDPGSTDPGPSGSGYVSANEVYNYLLLKKMSVNHAKGIVANISRESSFEIAARGDTDIGGSFGLFQWNKRAGRSGPMMKAVPDWKTNWKGQIDYALGEDYGPRYLSRTFSTAGEAAYDWMKYWERPSEEIQKQYTNQKYENIIKGLGLSSKKTSPPGGLAPLNLEEMGTTATPLVSSSSPKGAKTSALSQNTSYEVASGGGIIMMQRVIIKESIPVPLKGNTTTIDNSSSIKDNPFQSLHIG